MCVLYNIHIGKRTVLNNLFEKRSLYFLSDGVKSPETCSDSNSLKCLKHRKQRAFVIYKGEYYIILTTFLLFIPSLLFQLLFLTMIMHQMTCDMMLKYYGKIIRIHVNHYLLPNLFIYFFKSQKTLPWLQDVKYIWYQHFKNCKNSLMQSLSYATTYAVLSFLLVLGACWILSSAVENI